MEITSRQFGQIEAACFALEEATEKNNTALRLVKVIKDNLAEIAKTAYAGELTIDLEFEEIELPMVESDPMDNSKHQKICSLLKKWLRNHGITQEVLATRYKVSQSVISRQLSGKESIPEERIQDIINLTNPPDAEIELMNTLLTGESSSDLLATAKRSADGSDF